MRFFITLLCLLGVTVLPVLGTDYYVALNGNDKWSGTRSDPKADGTDGPFRTVEAAVAAVSAADGQKHRIVLRGGTHFLKGPLQLTADKIVAMTKRPSGREVFSSKLSAIVAHGDEQPVLSAGGRITGLREEKRGSQTVWVAALPEVKAGKRWFRQLWVNGERAHRARLPKQGLYKVEACAKGPWTKPQDRFTFAKGNVRKWRHLGDIDVAMYNYWVHDLLPVQSVDETQRRIVMTRTNSWGSLEHGRYRVENVFEALTEPGEWCLVRETGKLYYLPKPGQVIAKAEILAPVHEAVVRIEGSVDGKRPVKGLRFVGIAFSHNGLADVRYAKGMQPQAAWSVPGAVRIANAAGIRFVKCRIEHVGTYGLECATGTRDIDLTRCVLRDLGGGGVKLWGGTERANITDCEIGDGGYLFGQGCGVLIGRSHGNRILHNNIHDFNWAGISMGWNWGPGANCIGNVVEHNRIFNIGRGRLCDMGGIYMIGRQPGTRIRFNNIHHVSCSVYGGWGIYGDGWTSDVLIESNLIHHTTTGAFHTNSGVNLEVRNNIFAFGKLHQLSFQYPNAPHTGVLARNIIVSDGKNLTNGEWNKMKIHTADNIVWDLAAGAGGKPNEKQLKGLGAVYADPGLVDPKNGDFHLKPDARARTLGFVPWDYTQAGPRPEAEKTAPAKAKGR